MKKRNNEYYFEAVEALSEGYFSFVESHWQDMKTILQGKG
jgi:hypothetical protein